MKQFRYLTDRLFLTAGALYAVNRWGLKPWLSNPFLHGYFNDLLLIPCALPPLLWLHWKLGLRPHENPPTGSEVVLHLAVWSVICEWIGPTLTPLATGDRWDVLAYGTGALLSFLWWHRYLLLPRLHPT